MKSYRMTSVALALILAFGMGGAGMVHGAQLAEAAGQGKAMQGMGPGMGQRQGMGPGMMSGQTMGPGMMGQGMNPAMMGRYVEGRIAFLHTELKITAAQEKLWDTYATALRASATRMADMQATMVTMMNATTLPERLDAAEAMMSERLDALKRVKAAALPLYAQLDAQQKATADELMPAMGMGMAMGPGMGMGMGMGMGWGMGR